VAYANATSSAQLAALYPEAGGTYVYARKRLGEYWGFLAGWSFVVGKTASLAAMALTFGAYLSEDLARPLGIGAVVAMATVNYRGVEKTARLTRVIVALVLAALAVVVAAALLGGTASTANLDLALPAGPFGVAAGCGAAVLRLRRLRPAGDARRGGRRPPGDDPAGDPDRARHRGRGLRAGARPALLALGPAQGSAGPAPLAPRSPPAAGRADAGRPRRRGGRRGGVLLSLLAGISRTALSMARRRELPGYLDAVHPRFRTPHRAEATARCSSAPSCWSPTCAARSGSAPSRC
jgi:basic amino acid/polyamine antiporter, APA family